MFNCILLSSLVLCAGAQTAAPVKPVSIGDRLVLENHYLQKYTTLPLTAKDAAAQGFEVSDTCQSGLGHRANNGTFRIWYDKAGAVMGYGLTVFHGVATPPWRAVGSLFSGSRHYEMDYLFRDPAAACEDGNAAVPGSIGDRLLLVTDSGAPVELPLTQSEAAAANFKDGKPCWTDMGHHMVYPHGGASLPFSPVMTMYSGDGSRLTGVNTPILFPQSTPPSEYFHMGHGGPVYGQHVYFIDTKGVCGTAPTLAPFPKSQKSDVVV